MSTGRSRAVVIFVVKLTVTTALKRKFLNRDKSDRHARDFGPVTHLPKKEKKFRDRHIPLVTVTPFSEVFAGRQLGDLAYFSWVAFNFQRKTRLKIC